MQKTGNAAKENPFRTKGKVGLWDERLPGNDDKGHRQACGSKKSYLVSGVLNTRFLHDYNFSRLD